MGTGFCKEIYLAMGDGAIRAELEVQAPSCRHSFDSMMRF